VNPRGHAVVNFGPFRVPGAGAIGLALTGVRARSPDPGPPVIISPVEARYLEPGEAIIRQDALRQAGPGGLRGLWLPVGTGAGFRVAPGIGGRVDALLTGASSSGRLEVTVEMAGTKREITVSRDPVSVRVGPFPRVQRVIRLRARGPRDAQLFISRILVRPATSA
jgi:hypothetical protein